MRRVVLAAIAALMGWVGSASAQGWNDDRSLARARAATERRARELADSGLVDYKARAHGFLTFLGQIVEEPQSEPPKIVKADELMLQVYWKSPNLSKQLISGRRDTTLLPTDISYHRDHLGIVQNNFPGIIRLGDGDEVLDVPHPLSPTGLSEYDFAVGDSLKIVIPGREITVDILRVRPKDDRQPRVVGAVFVERETGQVVQMAFSFTRSAFRDKALEDISVILESSLVEGRYWLPSRQEIEIRRTGTWLEYPVRGIIRGRWEICCHEVNTGIPASMFAGPEIVATAPPQQLRRGFQGRILDSLPPDVRAVTDEDVRQIQEEARRLVRHQALERRRGAALGVRGISDFVRVNRVEGLALGGALAGRWGGGMVTSAAARYGFDDHFLKARASIAARRASGSAVELFAMNDFRDVGDVQEVSLARNSIAAQEFGSDYTDPYRAMSVGARLRWVAPLGMVWRLEGAAESQHAVAIHAQPASGRYEPTIPALTRRGFRGELSLERGPPLTVGGMSVRGGASLTWVEMKAIDSTSRAIRWVANAETERAFGKARLLTHTLGAGVARTGVHAAQDLVYLGGPVTGPGYEFHAFAARAAAMEHVELQFSVPFVPVPLGRFGRAGGEGTLAPYLHVVYVSGNAARSPDPSDRAAFFPSAGVGFYPPFEILRIDVARGLRDGRWTFGIDLTRDFWRVL
ncbi:MAG TPA: hypothetical protein VHM67_03150 [Gemmatimonadaceae bacterium]|nr:hypothetical protein [Gemmatimonadaceae bacterium]